MAGFIDQIRQAAAKRIFYLPHALRQMTRPERMILAGEVREVVTHGELIEDYPEDVRGHSCLLLGYGENNQAHPRRLYAENGLFGDHYSLSTQYR
jgi:hypothetical protein